MNERCKQIYTKSGLVVDKNLGIYFEHGTMPHTLNKFSALKSKIF